MQQRRLQGKSKIKEGATLRFCRKLERSTRACSRMRCSSATRPSRSFLSCRIFSAALAACRRRRNSRLANLLRHRHCSRTTLLFERAYLQRAECALQAVCILVAAFCCLHITSSTCETAHMEDFCRAFDRGIQENWRGASRGHQQCDAMTKMLAAGQNALHAVSSCTLLPQTSCNASGDVFIGLMPGRNCVQTCAGPPY